VKRPNFYTILVGCLVWASHPFVSHASVTQFQAHIEGVGSRPADRPELNTSPQHVLVLRGRKDPDLELWLGVELGTSNNQCLSQSWVARLEGAPDGPQSNGDYVRIAPGQTTFSVRFFLDRYRPGRCGWRPLLIEHAEFVPGPDSRPSARSGVAGISDNGQREATIGWICHQDRTPPSSHASLICTTTKHSPFGVPAISIEGAVLDLDFRLVPAGFNGR
jgi:hypothetical protein